MLFLIEQPEYPPMEDTRSSVPYLTSFSYCTLYLNGLSDFVPRGRIVYVMTTLPRGLLSRKVGLTPNPSDYKSSQTGLWL